MKLTLLAFILLLSCSVLGQSNPCQTIVNASDFWFGFMEAPKTLNRGVMIRSFGAFSITHSINNKIIFEKENIGGAWITGVTGLSGSEVIQKAGNHIVTDHPAAVFAQMSSDATQIIPTANLGNEYYVMCYTPRSITEFLIVATQDNTTLDITPSVNTAGGHLSNQTFPITLNQGEVYQVQSANLPGLPGQRDLTGSYIKSNNRIAVFSGSYESALPSAPNSYNHFFEEMIPVQSWGTRFVALPFQKGKEDFFRIMASLPHTTIKIAGNTYVLNNPGEYRDITLPDPAMIESNNPVLVAQYSSGTDRNGKPFMILVKSVNQTANKSLGFDGYSFVNLIVRTDAVNFIKVKDLWGKALSVNYQVIPGTEFSYSQINNSNFIGNIETTVPGKGFIAYEFQSGTESYGLSYNDIESKEIVLDLGGIKDNQGRKVLTLCDGEGPKTLDAGFDFTSYEWSTGESTRTIKVDKEGIYTVKATASGGCVLYDTVKIVLSKPVINLGKDLLECDIKPVVLDAGTNNQFNSYLWSTPQGSLTDPKITASQSGTYIIKATTMEGCNAKDTINVTIGAKPKFNFSKLDTLICGQKSALLNISADKGSYTLQRQDNGLTFSGLQASVPDWGTWPFKFTATDASGCSTDTTFKIGFHKIPEVDFSIDSTKCYHYNLEVKYIGDAVVNTTKFTWVFGGDTIANGTGIDSYTIPLGVNKSKRDLSLKVVQDGCWNADTIKDIKVIPDLEMKIVNSLGCEPFNAEFIAKNTETVTYDWNFGDGTSKRLDDHPFHLYQNDGYYNVDLKVTTTRGCANSVSADSIVHVAPIPTVGFSLDPLNCLDLGNHSIFYVGTGDAKDSYQWDLTGFDPQEIIQNPINTQGPFIFNLKNKPQSSVGLQVISQYGCKSAIGNSLVKRVPFFSMNVAGSTGCVPLETEFEGIIGDNVDQVSYSWDFGDGTTGTGEEISHIYNDPGDKYTVTLQALSAITGCTDTIKKIDLVHPHPNPKADFSMDHPIVYNDKPDVRFENLSTGAVNYLWDFGDGSTSTEANVIHKYQVMGYQKVLLQSFNEFMCSDTISHTVLVGTAHLFPPNAFSPNAPNPVDREFKLNQETIKEEGYHLAILSRWNDIVFETKNEIRGWDGRMRNGDFAPSGNYLWILEFTDFLDRKHLQTGAVTLIY